MHGHAQDFLGEWRGALVCDDYSGYKALLTNHFNPSAHSIAPEAWREAVLRLNRPENLLAVAEFDQLACPTMFLVGAEDPIVPPAVMRELGQRLSGSEVVVVKETAHSAYFEKPLEFNQTALDFLRRRTDR